MSANKQNKFPRRAVLIAFVAITTIGCTTFAQSGEKIIQESEKMNINVIVEFEVKAEQVSEFTAILNSVKADLPKVEGCIGVEIFKSASVNNKFTLVETWETKELHQAHLNRLAKDGGWETIAAHLAKDPKSDYYTML